MQILIIFFTSCIVFTTAWKGNNYLKDPIFIFFSLGSVGMENLPKREDCKINFVGIIFENSNLVPRLVEYNMKMFDDLEKYEPKGVLWALLKVGFKIFLQNVCSHKFSGRKNH